MEQWQGRVEDMERLKMLITGGTGFVGANLARYFNEIGHEISITRRDKSNLWRINDILGSVRSVTVDLSDSEAVNELFHLVKPDVVIHTAAFGGYHFEVETKRIFDVNLYGTINLLNAFHRLGNGILVNTGSSSEYGFKSQPMSEMDVIEPFGDYAVSKAAATLYARYKAVETSDRIFTLRLFSPYGYYEESHRLIPYVLISALTGRTAKLNNPDFVRDFIFIGDVCKAYESVIVKSFEIENGEIFNVGSGHEETVREVAETANEICGGTLKMEWGTNEQRIGDNAKRWVADISKIKRKINWEPIVTLREGMVLTYSWLKNNIGKYEVTENSKIGSYIR